MKGKKKDKPDKGGDQPKLTFLYKTLIPNM